MMGSYEITDCHVCSTPVPYKEGRRRCTNCRRWFHVGCGMDSKYNGDAKEALCFPCFKENPRKPVRALAKAMNKGVRFPALEVVLWSLHLDQDEAEISAKLKIPLEEVQEMSKRLRDQGVWKDGKVHVDCDDDAEGDEFSVCLILAALCAEGQIVRTPVGPPDVAVRDGRGNEK